MLDCSRNAIPNKEFLRKWIDILADCGYNELQLYTEDTFQVENEPYFGYLRGGFSVAEIQEIDIDGSFTSIDKNAPRTENIRIEGGIWSESNRERLGYGKTGKFDDGDTLHGVTCTMLFSGVNKLVLQNMTFTHSAGFAVQIGRCENFTVKNIRCRILLQSGQNRIMLRKKRKNCLIPT